MDNYRLKICNLLDPRDKTESANKPILDSVNIPFIELCNRMHELPPREQIIQVADIGTIAKDTVQWLNAHRRKAELTSYFYFGANTADYCLCLWQPNEFLLRCMDKLKPGSALDIACGKGREAVWMATRDWQVCAVDNLPESIDDAKALEQIYCRNCHSIDWLVQDIEKEQKPLPGNNNLVCMFFYLNRELVKVLPDLLSTGGNVLIETFTTTHRERYGKPLKDKHVLKPNEILSLLPSLDVIEHEEAFHGWRHTVRFWARKS